MLISLTVETRCEITAVAPGPLIPIMPVNVMYSHAFNHLLYSLPQRHNSPGTRTLNIQNDPSPIFGHFAATGR